MTVSRFALPTSLSVFAVLLTVGCRSLPEAPAPVEAPPPAPEVPAERQAWSGEWPGSTWILRDPDNAARTFPGYRGFHLGRDGRLLLINMDQATGDVWTARDNVLRFTLNGDSEEPGLPLSGEFSAWLPDEEAPPPAVSGTQRILLIPSDRPEAAGLLFEEARVNVDIVENHWIPRDLEGGETVMWPMNREIHLMLLPDATGGMGLLGYGGENRFRGSVLLDGEQLVPGPISITRKAGPASEFERLYVGKIAESNRYVQVEDDLFLYNDTRPKAAFRVRLFD